MSHDVHHDGDAPTDDPALADRQHAQFRRNLFFHGKLMTARDMQTEQDYHRARLEALADGVLGSGVVSGLDVTLDPDDAGDESTVTAAVERGLAIDGAGRPLVVAPSERGTLGRERLDEDDPVVSVWLHVDPCATEKVPVEGAEDACGQDCTYNRVVEAAAVAVEPGEPTGLKPVHEVDAPTGPPGEEAERADHLQAIARSYYAHAADADGERDGRVFLGTYRETEGDWDRVDGYPIERVYSNEMLYAALTRHVTDFGNPHDVVAALAGDGERVEPAEGAVDLVGGPGIDVDPAPEDSRIDIGVTADSVEDLVRDLLEEFDDEFWERIGAGIRTLEGAGPDDGGNVDLVSQTETIDFDADEENAAVSVDISPELADRLDEIEDRLDALEGGEFDVEELEPPVLDVLGRANLEDYLDYDLGRFQDAVDQVDRVPVDLEDLHRDIEGLEERFETPIDELDTVLGDSIQTEISDLDTTLREEIDAEISDLDTTLRSEIDSEVSQLDTTLRDEIESEVSTLDTELRGEIDSLDQQFSAEIDAVNADLANAFTGLEDINGTLQDAEIGTTVPDLNTTDLHVNPRDYDIVIRDDVPR